MKKKQREKQMKPYAEKTAGILSELMFALLLALVAMLMMSTSVYAVDKTLETSVTSTGSGLKAGDEFTVTINLDNDNSALRSYNAEISYNPDQVEPVTSVQNGNTVLQYESGSVLNGMGDDKPMLAVHDNQTYISAGFASAVDVNGQGSLLILHFKVKNTAAAGNAGISYKVTNATWITAGVIDQNQYTSMSPALNVTDNSLLNTITITPSAVSVTYQGHVEDYGWMDWVKDGNSAGTTGEAKRVEAIRVRITGDDNLGVSYSAHVQDIGWMNPVADGALAGTEHQCKRVEAFQMNLTGADANKYDIYYRVHAENAGWMNWAKNGEKAGTAGFCYRLEAIQIQVVPKGEPAPAQEPASLTDTAFMEACNISMIGQIENIGWGQGWQKANQMQTATVGTCGQFLRVESFRVSCSNPDVRISYRAHVQDIGWQDWVSNGGLAGTVGMCKRVEAFEMVADNLPDGYELQYRAHVENTGWQNWVKAGQMAGTTGQSLQIEALQIRLVKVN